jgi:hypothetical protein
MNPPTSEELLGLLGKLPNTIEIRAWHILQSEGISTIDQLCALSRPELLRVPNCGRKTVDAIENALFAIGRELRSSSWRPTNWREAQAKKALGKRYSAQKAFDLIEKIRWAPRPLDLDAGFACDLRDALLAADELIEMLGGADHHCFGYDPYPPA